MLKFLRRYDITARNGEFLQIAGLHVRFNVSKPTGQRVVYAEAMCAACVVPEYSPLILNHTYKVIMNEYPYHGGDGFTLLKNKNGTMTKVIDIDNLMDYIKRKGVLYTKIESRIIFEGEQKDDDEIHKPSKGNKIVLATYLTIALYTLIALVLN